MANTTVKNIPDYLLDQLRKKAKKNQRSLNSEMIMAIKSHVMKFDRPSPEEIIRKAREFRGKIKVMLSPEEIENAINEGRE
ncbi:MAG TPA: Arc family DNA-binding protein [Cyclobacteriaceae bacterium]